MVSLRLVGFIGILILQIPSFGQNEDEEDRAIELLHSMRSAHVATIEGLRKYDCLIEIRMSSLRDGGKTIVEHKQITRFQSFPEDDLRRCVSHIVQDVDVEAKRRGEPESRYKPYDRLVFCSLVKDKCFVNDFVRAPTRPGRESVTPERTFYTETGAPRLHRTAILPKLHPGSQFDDKTFRNLLAPVDGGSGSLRERAKVTAEYLEGGDLLEIVYVGKNVEKPRLSNYLFDTSLNVIRYRKSKSEFNDVKFSSISTMKTWWGEYESQTVPRWQIFRSVISQKLGKPRDDDVYTQVSFIWLDSKKRDDELWKAAATDPAAASSLLEVSGEPDRATPLPGYEDLPKF